MDDCHVHVCNRFFTVRQVKRGDAHFFKAVMDFARVNDWEEKLTGLRCDETNNNIAAGGL